MNSAENNSIKLLSKMEWNETRDCMAGGGFGDM